MGPETAAAHDSRPAAASIAVALPLMAVVVVAYLVTGIAMPVLPVYVHQGLGLGTFVVGLVAGTQFSAAFMVARVAFGHVPDRMGGVRVALFCMLIEAAGLALVWRASGSTAALVGVTLTGLGYSLVYPGLGVEAVRLAPPQSRGVVMGTYTAFLDLALGLASPTLGWLADAGGLSLVFLVSGVVVAGTAVLGTLAVQWDA